MNSGLDNTTRTLDYVHTLRKHEQERKLQRAASPPPHRLAPEIDIHGHVRRIEREAAEDMARLYPASAAIVRWYKRLFVGGWITYFVLAQFVANPAQSSVLHALALPLVLLTLAGAITLALLILCAIALS